MAQFTNQATLSYNGSVYSSNIAVGEILDVLAVTKTAARASYVQGDIITYVIGLRNTGATALTGLTITDNLGAYQAGTPAATVYPLTARADSVLYYANGVLQAAPTVTAGPPLVISGISVPAGGDAVIVYETAANAYTPLGTGAEITNTATVSGAAISDVTAAETVTAAQTPILSISKAVSPVPVAENGVLTYTFTIQNSGGTALTAADTAVIADTFDPRLTGLTVSYNGAAWTAGTDYTYDETTGVFQTAAGKLTVPAATYAQDTATGAWVVTPGSSTLTVSGTIA